MKRLISLLLCGLLFLLPLSATADDAFVALLSVLAEEDVLGTDGAELMNFDMTEEVVLYYYSAPDQLVSLSGRDNEGNATLVQWSNVPVSRGMVTLIQVLSFYETVEPYLSEGTHLGVAFVLHEGDDPVIAESAEDAKSLEAYFMQMLKGLSAA